MIPALNVATEAYLDTALNTSDLVVPTRFSGYARKKLDAILKNLRLRRTIGAYYYALKAAVAANDIALGQTCNYDHPLTQLILAVIYTRSDLTLLLLLDDECVSDELRYVQRVDLAADCMAGAFEQDEGHRQNIKSQIEEIAKLPVLGVGDDVPNMTSQCVLLGDRVMSEKFSDVLEYIVGVELVQKGRTTSALESADPVFTAANGPAYWAKQSIDAGEGSCLAWNCSGFLDSWQEL